MSKITDGMGWFKHEFGPKIQIAIKNTPFSLDLLTAIAVQETYYVWSKLYPKLATGEVLTLCVGDTIDAPNRSAFPIDKAALLDAPNGDKMFKIAREALESVAKYVPDYKKATKSRNKFCHGFGIFQYDIQFFPTDPDYFLKKGWSDFDTCLAMCIHELKGAQKRAKLDKSKLSDRELAYVAIAYNAGHFVKSRGLKQGFRDSGGKYYGEYIWDYLNLAKEVSA